MNDELWANVLANRMVMVGILEMLIDKGLANNADIREMIERRGRRAMDNLDAAGVSNEEIERQMGKLLAQLADDFD